MSTHFLSRWLALLKTHALVITLLVILGLVLGCWAFLIALDMNVGGFIEKQPQTVPTWLEEKP